MCGIAGFCHSDARPADRELLGIMISTLRHRGPDAMGIYAGRGIGLAHARLSIIDVAGGGQPMGCHDGSLWIIFNGEIFNYLELREQLIAKGHRFRTNSDTEVILHLYQEEGRDCVQHLNGQWAFALWDARQRSLFLSRDRLGVRPLFYTLRSGTLIFGSEIKSILAHPDIQPGIDLIGLDHVFTFWYTLPPHTIFSGISELPPGHSLAFEDGHISTQRYWQPDFSPQNNRLMPECVEELTSLLTDATRIRLRSDVPVGAYLSGGLDSSIVTALAKNCTRNPLRTFSISFASKDLDESSFQDEAARFLNTDHERLQCSYGDIAEAFPDLIWHLEKPIIRTAPAPMYLLSGLVHGHDYKVVLTGEGADEILGGYDIFKEAKLRRFWASQPDSHRRPLLLRRLYPYQPNLQKQSDAYLQKFFRVTADDVQNPFFSHLPRWELTARAKIFFSDEVVAALSRYDALSDLEAQLPSGFAKWPSFSKAQYLETAFLLPGYILSSQGDRPAMAHSVEARHPFLDYRLVEFGAKLPPEYKMKVLNEKAILKQASRRLLPQTIINRPKQPYRAPDGCSFFAAGTLDYVNQLLSSSEIRAAGLFDHSAVTHLVNKFKSGAAIGVKDNMALIGILSTQLVICQFTRCLREEGKPCDIYKKICATS